MSAWLIALVGVIYAVVAVSLVMEKKYGMAIAFVGYTIGNVGLFMVAKGV